MDLIDILHSEAVRTAHSVGSKKRLFQDLAAVAGQAYGINPEVAIEALLERETLGPTGVGRGVALPHARLDTIDHIVGCFMKLDRPVEFDAVDRQQQSYLRVSGPKHGLHDLLKLRQFHCPQLHKPCGASLSHHQCRQCTYLDVFEQPLTP